MPLDAQVQRFLGALAASGRGDRGDWPIEQRRAALAALLTLSDPSAARAEDTDLAGPTGPIRARIYTPLEAPDGPLPGLVYFHGGGLVAGSLDSHAAIARALARAGACRVVAVQYRLAPEHRFPAALEDADAAIHAIGARAEAFGIDRRRLGIAGDSAGGTLAAAACRRLIDAGTLSPALLVLLCPILDPAGSTDSRREFASGYLVDQATLDYELRHYLDGTQDPADPRISPLRAPNLTGMPPTILHTAECDPLRDEAHAFAERLRADGVPVTTTCHAGMIHLFYALGQVIPYAREAWIRIGADIRAGWAR